jgi:glycosyltransferase involved in cell wall biosynthesis
MGDSILRWKRWALASERENFVFPLFEPLVAHSLGVLVHNRCAAEAVRRHLPGRPVRHVPMGIAPGVELDPRGARERLGLAEDRVVVGAFGFLTPIKRIPVLASALRRAWRECPELRLVLVGETSPGFRIEEIFEPQELRSGKVAHLGYVSPEGYRDWMAAVDLAVNLRYPTTLETSASLLRLLGQGKCTFVSAYRQFLEIPADAVVRIPLGINEEETLARELVSLARDSERRRRVGAAARAFVEREHSLSQAASAFSAAVCEIARTAADPKPDFGNRWKCPAARGRERVARPESRIVGRLHRSERGRSRVGVDGGANRGTRRGWSRDRRP